MAHGLRFGTITAVSLLMGWSARHADPDACKLLSVAEASALNGSSLTQSHTSSNAGFSTCVYALPNENLLNGMVDVEIHYWLLADVPSAQAKFQRVVHPGPMTGTTVTAVPGLGDEADIKRTVSFKLNSVEFRRGTAIVTIGVSPLVSDSALLGAGKMALSRL